MVFSQKKIQCVLKHIGAITIKKSQGATFVSGFAIKLSPLYSPWEKGHIVVLLNRSTTLAHIIIVGKNHMQLMKYGNYLALETSGHCTLKKSLNLIGWMKMLQILTFNIICHFLAEFMILLCQQIQQASFIAFFY